MRLLPGHKFCLTWFAAVWNGQAGASVAAIRDHSGTADGEDEPGVGIDEDLVVGARLTVQGG